MRKILTQNEFKEKAKEKLKGKKGEGLILLTLKGREKEIFSRNLETTLITILLELTGRKKPSYKWVQLFLR